MVQPRLPLLSALMLAGALLQGCGGGEEAVTTRGPRSADLAVDSKLVTATNDFGFRLYRELAATEGNIFFSPVSIELALGMAYNGARGSTRDAMARALGYGDLSLDAVNGANAQLLQLLANPDPKVDLYIANAVWARQGVTFDTGFMERCRTSFLAEPFTVDFKNADAANQINAWVKGKTRDKINEIVSADAIREALMVLTNALYFKAGWTDAFPQGATTEAPFTTGDGSKVTVPLMHRSGSFEYTENEQVQMIRIPYQGQFVGMTVILPKPGITVASVAESLNGETWKTWSKSMTPQSGRLALPRFKTDFSTSLKPALSALGMGVAFDPSQADLNGILPPDATSERVYISDALHKTYLSVDEQGTEAAAATAVIIGITSVPVDRFEMIVNRPFLLAITDKPTGVVLFLGSISKPR